jgi:hypothetical protein
MNKKILAMLLGMSILTFAGATAFARGGGGGGVPSPFVENSNRKVELADGEMYTLDGKVVFDNNDTPWFWVDLAKHPWLANQKRQQNPYYRLLGSKDQWRDYNDKAIELTCIAHVVVEDGAVVIQLSQVTAAGSKAVVETSHHSN